MINFRYRRKRKIKSLKITKNHILEQLQYFTIIKSYKCLLNALNVLSLVQNRLTRIRVSK